MHSLLKLIINSGGCRLSSHRGRSRKSQNWESGLELARDLATDVLSTRPATWQAVMILGAASLYESVGSGTAAVVGGHDANRQLRGIVEELVNRSGSQRGVGSLQVSYG